MSIDDGKITDWSDYYDGLTSRVRSAGLQIISSVSVSGTSRSLTEVQAHFRFDGANINKRLHEVWNALIPVPEIKELYDASYAQLMKDKGITSDSKPAI